MLRLFDTKTGTLQCDGFFPVHGLWIGTGVRRSNPSPALNTLVPMPPPDDRAVGQ